jgi:hypothetical protein
MSRFTVSLINTVSAAVEVEADTYDDAIEKAFESDDMPGPITYGAFGQADVDEGDWQPYSVYDEAGRTVWSERQGEIEA